MKLVQKFPQLGSSVDPQKLSATIKGVLGWIAAGLVLVGTFVGVQISSEELQPIIDAVGEVIAQITALISTVVFVFGAVRKVYLKFKK